MKRLFLFYCFLFFTTYLLSQDNNVPVIDENVVYNSVQTPPVFIGTGENNFDTINNKDNKLLLQFIFSNINYPLEARKYGIQGRVVTQFVVTKDGSINDIKLLKKIGGGCDEEALRLINLMNIGKMWKPGIKEGKPVNVMFTLPIHFKL
jgi:TonB family protein